MGRRRQLVPTALREELTEYSSLLRALRTADTLDLSSRLTRSQEPSSSEDEQSRASSTSSDDSSSRKRKRSRSSSESGETPLWRKRDHWTRWPILAKDVPPPDWSLQEEIGSIVKQALMSIEREPDDDVIVNQDENNDAEIDNDIDEEEAYIQDLATLLTPVIEDLHESLFALICAHTTARSDSMQNRIEPFDWHDLVNILGSPAAAHLVDEKTLQSVITKTQALCEMRIVPISTSIPPPSPNTVLERHRLVKASRSRLNSRLSKHTASLFEQNLPPPGYKYLTNNQIAKRKSKGKGKKSNHEVVEVEREDSTTSEGSATHSTTESGDNEESDWVETESDQER